MRFVYTRQDTFLFSSYIQLVNQQVKVKLSLCLTNLALRHEGVWGSWCIDPHFLDLSTSWRWMVSFTPLPLYPSERAPGTHWIGGWVGPRAGLDYVEKRKFLTLPGLELRPLSRPARSQSLYRLRYPGSCKPIGHEVYSRAITTIRATLCWHTFIRIAIIPAIFLNSVTSMQILFK
jgi:hypothetical protein